MSHVDDGELTAFADGAYPVDDPEALRISAHLSTCGNCRTRLEQSQELRSRAAEILAFATPVTMTAPSFESLQTQLATTSARKRPAIPLAWAATIVLALGIGWFGRGAWQFEEPATRSAAVQDAAVPTVAQAEAQPLTTGPTPAPAPAPTSARDLSRRTTNRTREFAEADQPQTQRAENAAADVAAGAAAGRASVANAPPPPPVASAEEVNERREAMVERRAVVIPGMQYMTAGEAERRGLNVPRIPELPIARIGVDASTTIVVHTLPDGKLVTVTAMPEAREAAPRDAQKSVAAPAAPTAAAGQLGARDQFATTVKAGRKVTVTGDVSADSLRVLLGKVRVVD